MNNTNFAYRIGLYRKARLMVMDRKKIQKKLMSESMYSYTMFSVNRFGVFPDTAQYDVSYKSRESHPSV